MKLRIECFCRDSNVNFNLNVFTVRMFSNLCTFFSDSCCFNVASWIVDLYKHMQGEDELTLKGFKEAGIYEAIYDAQEVFERVESPFRA